MTEEQIAAFKQQIDELQKHIRTNNIMTRMSIIDQRRTQAIAYWLAQHIDHNAPAVVRDTAAGVIKRVGQDPDDKEQLENIIKVLESGDWV